MVKWWFQSRFGLLSFANDQLDECLSRVWTAESLLLEDAPWVGQKTLGRLYHHLLVLMCVYHPISMSHIYLQ